MSSSRGIRSKSIGHYVLMKTIGEGTFGKVKLGTHILTGERVAIKVLEKERIAEVADVQRVAREIHILKLIRHPHIIQLYEIIETPRQLYLIMEYASGGELFDYIVQHGRAEERDACRFLHQVLAGVERVHEMRVVHRDLKPENLLIDERKNIKIVDFGLSNTFKEGQLLQTACGSPCYAAPEMIAGHEYHPPLVDIWSCGVILFALVCGYLPFESQDDGNHQELYRKILSAEYEVPNFVSKEVTDLISGMLTTDPNLRLTLPQIRAHEWYREIKEASIPDVEDGSLDEGILDQLEIYGFPRDYAKKCLQSNKHNHVTTTYYLLKENKRPAKSGDATLAFDRAIAEMNAAGFEDHGFPSASTAAAVASVATPCKGQRDGSEVPQTDRRWAGRVSAQEPAPQVWPGGDAAGGDSASGLRQATPGPVPRLNLANVGQDGDCCHSSRSGSASRQPAVGSAPTREADVATRERPQSARGYSSGSHGVARRRQASADTTSNHRRAYGYYHYDDGVDAGTYDYGGYADMNPSDKMHRHRPASRPHSSRRAAAPEVPLTARPRMQGNTYGYNERYADRYRQQLPPAALGLGVPCHSSYVASAPLSARGAGTGPRSHTANEQWSPAGSCTISYNTSRPPRQTIQEVVRALTECRIAFRQVSQHTVRCHAESVRFEAEVVQLSRGGGFALRFSRVSGDVSQYRDICAQLLSEMML